jgi:hypothetical protein
MTNSDALDATAHCQLKSANPMKYELSTYCYFIVNQLYCSRYWSFDNCDFYGGKRYLSPMHEDASLKMCASPPSNFSIVEITSFSHSGRDWSKQHAGDQIRGWSEGKRPARSQGRDLQKWEIGKGCQQNLAHAETFVNVFAAPFTWLIVDLLEWKVLTLWGSRRRHCLVQPTWTPSRLPPPFHNCRFRYEFFRRPENSR